MNAAQLRAFEGRRVSIALAGGSRIDHCEVISAAVGAGGTIWVFSNGVDSFVPLCEVVNWWEMLPSAPGPPSQAPPSAISHP